ncbi:MAG: MFS transporter [Sphingopyxis sp.]|nr:MFS transporter [Sphingopyxis sp.]
MIVAAEPGEALREWKRHWRTLVACLAGTAASITHIPTFGVLLPSIQREYGWSVSEISAGMLILATVSLIASGFVGAAVDRFGSRRIGLAGLILYHGAFALLATTGPSILNWWLLWLLVGVGFSGTTTTIWAPAVAGRFHASRGLAIAVMLCGTGLSMTVMPLVATLLLEQFGWRGALVGCSAFVAVITIPLIAILLTDRPAGVPGSGEADGATVQPGLAVRDAIFSSTYIRIAISAVAFTIASLALIVHFVPILRGGGMTPHAAAAAAGAIGLAAIAGRLTAGLLLDRVHARFIAIICFGLPAVACALLLTDPGPAAAIAIGMLIGFSSGSELDVVAYSATRYFGLRKISTIYGVLVGLITFAAGVGPFLSGVMFDLFGSYDSLILSVIPLFLLGSLLMGTLPAYPRWGEEGR